MQGCQRELEARGRVLGKPSCLLFRAMCCVARRMDRKIDSNEIKCCWTRSQRSRLGDSFFVKKKEDILCEMFSHFCSNETANANLFPKVRIVR